MPGDDQPGGPATAIRPADPPPDRSRRGPHANPHPNADDEVAAAARGDRSTAKPSRPPVKATVQLGRDEAAGILILLLLVFGGACAVVASSDGSQMYMAVAAAIIMFALILGFSNKLFPDGGAD